MLFNDHLFICGAFFVHLYFKLFSSVFLSIYLNNNDTTFKQYQRYYLNVVKIVFPTLDLLLMRLEIDEGND